MKQQSFGDQTFDYNSTIDCDDYNSYETTPEEQAAEEKAECHEMFRLVQAYKGVIYKTVKFNLAEMFERENFMSAEDRIGKIKDENLERAFSEKRKLDQELYKSDKKEYKRGLFMIDIFSKCQNILINQPVKKISDLVDNVIKFDLKETKEQVESSAKIIKKLFKSHDNYNQALYNHAQANRTY